ncbi:MAG TPA: phage holin family protein, partial [Candidatus Dormibacteraeota bacterium]|nr:phage holin family protein [Candidatus Dormibacteraeota bacterium]
AVTAWVLHGIVISGGVFGLLGVALLFGLVNAVLGTVLRLLTLPIRLLTLGLFTFLINALLLLVTANLSSNLRVANFLTALEAAVIISVVSTLLNRFVLKSGRGWRRWLR